MTETLPPAPVEPRRLDLSLFRLPTAPDPRNAEVGIGRPDLASSGVKRRFWATLAKRLDLTGPGSLVRVGPYGTGHDRVLAGLEAKIDALIEEIRKAESANVLLSADKARPSQLPRRVATLMEEVTPQFFLRNIPRVERPSVSVRRLNFRYAVWRDGDEELIEFARHPELDPVEFLSEFSSSLLKGLRREAWERVYGLDWEHDVGNFRPVMFRAPAFGVEEKKRVPVSELKVDPAPPNRETSNQRHLRTLKALSKRFDATRE